MAKQGVGLRECARQVDKAPSYISKLAGKQQIPRFPDGSFDVEAVRSAIKAKSDPARTKAVHQVETFASPVNTIEDARDAVSLIRKVLAEEGRTMDASPTFDDVRTAETILKTRERAQAIAQNERELVAKRPMLRHIEEAFANYKRELQALPARFGAQIAAEVGCDVGKLDRALTKVIHDHLDGLSGPVVKGT